MKQKPEVEICEWDGRIWRRYPNSKGRSHRVYFQRHEKWRASPVYLHREKWKKEHGPIPSKCEIHHKDDNPLNNDISNLECITVKEHRARHRETYKNSPRVLGHLKKQRKKALPALLKWLA